MNIEKNIKEDIEEDIEECSICGDELSIKYKHTLKCNHTFHYECLQKSLKFSKKNNCPICRDKFDFLEPVNGIKKLIIDVHYNNKNKEIINNYNNIKCDYIFTKGKNINKKCNKNCKLGFFKCNTHIKKK